MAWSSSETIQLTCTKKWLETPDSVSFELSSDSGNETFHFKAGQFSSLGFDIEGKTAFRAYSISSIPGGNRLKFTVKRVLMVWFPITLLMLCRLDKKYKLKRLLVSLIMSIVRQRARC